MVIAEDLESIFALYPLPLPPAQRGGKGNFFCGFLQAGVARLQKPNFFLPLPDGAYAVGEGAGGGAKATAHKGSSIAATWRQAEQ